MGKVYHKSEKMDWGTPDDIFDSLYAEFGFQVDVCASDANHKCEEYYTEDQNGLIQPWSNGLMGACWMNPPYGREIGKWIQKAYDEKANGVTTVCLVPARTDTKWWSIFWDHEEHSTRDKRDEVRFVKGRIRFEGATASAPFPSAILVFRGNVEKKWCSRCCHHIYMDDPCTQHRTCGLNQDIYNEK